jgi:hypothetical protein
MALFSISFERTPMMAKGATKLDVFGAVLLTFIGFSFIKAAEATTRIVGGF